jgi:hypothetical protein
VKAGYHPPVTTPAARPEARPASARLTASVAAPLLILATLAVAFIAFRAPSLELDEVVEETHDLLEWIAVGVWVAGAGVAAWAATRQRSWRMVLLAAWFGVLSLLATLRELDLHVVLNPANIHLIGLDAAQAVRFRLDWWTDPATPIGLRAVWGAVFLVVGAAVVLPFALARYPWFTGLRARHPFPWLVAVAFGLLAASYALDDFIGRPLARVGVDVALFEEIGELIGPCVLVAAVVLLGLRGGRSAGSPSQPEPKPTGD